MRVTDEMVKAFWDAYTDEKKKAVVPLSDALRADIRAGLEAALAAAPQPEGLETTHSVSLTLRNFANGAARQALAKQSDTAGQEWLLGVRDIAREAADTIDRLLARLAAADAEKAKAVEAEREACAVRAENEPEPIGPMPNEFLAFSMETNMRAAIRGTRKAIAAAIRSRKGGENG